MEKEVNCLNSKAILGYVKEHNNGDYSSLLKNLDPEIDALKDPERFLIDPNNWISCTVASKLYERARMILKDELTAYKIAPNMLLKKLSWVMLRESSLRVFGRIKQDSNMFKN